MGSSHRCAELPVPANILEGFKRRGRQDKIRFYNIAEASLEELKYYLILSQDLTFLPDNRELAEHADSVSRLLYRLIQSIQQNQRRI